jgi:hypothetical protein
MGMGIAVAVPTGRLVTSPRPQHPPWGLLCRKLRVFEIHGCGGWTEGVSLQSRGIIRSGMALVGEGSALPRAERLGHPPRPRRRGSALPRAGGARPYQ